MPNVTEQVAYEMGYSIERDSRGRLVVATPRDAGHTDDFDAERQLASEACSIRRDASGYLQVRETR